MVLMMLETTRRVLGPEEQPKSAMPKKFLGNVLQYSDCTASSIMGLPIDIAFLCKM